MKPLIRCVSLLLLAGQLALPVFAQTTRSIGFGDNLVSRLLCGDTNTFTFEAEAGDVVVVQVVELVDDGGVCKVACFCFDQSVTLSDDQGRVLKMANSPGGDNTQNRFRTRLTAERLSAAGTFWVWVGDANDNGRGQFSLFVQRVSGPDRSEPLRSGDALLIDLNRGEVDTFTLEAAAGDYVEITMTADERGEVEPRLELYDGEGRAVAIADGGRVAQTLTGSGPFTLLAYSSVDQEGTYRLSLRREASPANYPPLAGNDGASTPLGVAVTVDVLANDADPDGDPLSVVDVTQGMNGGVTNHGVAVTYEPDAGFTGIDTFVYTVSDGKAEDTAFVAVSVTAEAPSGNRPPVAIDDRATTQVGTPVTVTVLANDVDLDGDAIAVTEVSQGANGSAGHDGAAVTYTPDEGFAGMDSFTYTVSDGRGADVGTVTVQVTSESAGVPLSVTAGDRNPTSPRVVSGSVQGLPVAQLELTAGAETVHVERVRLVLDHRGGNPAAVGPMRAALLSDADGNGEGDAGEVVLARAGSDTLAGILDLQLAAALVLEPRGSETLVLTLDIDRAARPAVGWGWSAGLLPLLGVLALASRRRRGARLAMLLAVALAVGVGVTGCNGEGGVTFDASVPAGGVTARGEASGALSGPAEAIAGARVTVEVR